MQTIIWEIRSSRRVILLVIDLLQCPSRFPCVDLTFPSSRQENPWSTLEVTFSVRRRSQQLPTSHFYRVREFTINIGGNLFRSAGESMVRVSSGFTRIASRFPRVWKRRSILKLQKWPEDRVSLQAEQCHQIRKWFCSTAQHLPPLSILFQYFQFQCNFFNFNYYIVSILPSFLGLLFLLGVVLVLLAWHIRHLFWDHIYIHYIYNIYIIYSI